MLSFGLCVFSVDFHLTVSTLSQQCKFFSTFSGKSVYLTDKKKKQIIAPVRVDYIHIRIRAVTWFATMALRCCE